MSYSQAFEKVISDFITDVANQFNLDREDVMRVWTGEQKAKSKPSKAPAEKKSSKQESKQESKQDFDLTSLKKDELATMCKCKGLKSTGTKEELIARLGGAPLPSKKSAEKQVKKVSDKPAKVTKVRKPDGIEVKLNKHGNYVHEETQLVFDKLTQQVIGYQNPKGDVDTLTDDNIETCKKYGFTYTIPENIVKDDDVDSDEDVEEFIDEEDVQSDDDGEDDE